MAPPGNHVYNSEADEESVLRVLFEVDPLGLRIFTTFHARTYAPEAKALTSILRREPLLPLNLLADAVADIIEDGVGFRPAKEFVVCISTRLMGQAREPEEEPA
jgi:hypothetical protein